MPEIPDIEAYRVALLHLMIAGRTKERAYAAASGGAETRPQAVGAGIGNAYSDEILFRAQKSPFAITSALDDNGLRALSRLLKDDWPRRIEDLEQLNVARKP